MTDVHECDAVRQLRFIHAMLDVAQRGQFLDDLMWHSDGSDVTVSADVSDIFSWGYADAEPLTADHLPLLEQALAELEALDAAEWTTYLVVARIRQRRPQGARYPTDRAVQELFDACGPQRAIDMANPHRRFGRES